MQKDLPKSSNEALEQTEMEQTLASEIALSESKDIVENPPFVPYSTLSSALMDCIHDEDDEVPEFQCSAPPLLTSVVLNEISYEYTLPQCYSLDDLKNFYSNQSANAIDAYENDFIQVSLYIFMSNSFQFIRRLAVITYFQGRKKLMISFWNRSTLLLSHIQNILFCD